MALGRARRPRGRARARRARVPARRPPSGDRCSRRARRRRRGSRRTCRRSDLERLLDPAQLPRQRRAHSSSARSRRDSRQRRRRVRSRRQVVRFARRRGRCAASTTAIDGADGAPVLVLSNSLGTDLSMWDAADRRRSRRAFRVLRYDTRGHGAVGRHARALHDRAARARRRRRCSTRCEIERAHFCGLSMGGMTGMWLGVQRRQRLAQLVLAQHRGADRLARHLERAHRDGAHRRHGGHLATRCSSAGSRRRSSQREPPNDRAHAGRCWSATPADGYVACCAAVRDMDQRDAIARDPRADARHRRHARRRHAAGGRPVPRGAHSGRAVRRARCRAPVQHRGGAGVHRGGARPFSTPRRTSMDDRERYDAGNEGAPRRAGRRARRPRAREPQRDSTRSSRTSSRATRGARSGRARACRATRAACSRSR